MRKFDEAYALALELLLKKIEELTGHAGVQLKKEAMDRLSASFRGAYISMEGQDYDSAVRLLIKRFGPGDTIVSGLDNSILMELFARAALR